MLNPLQGAALKLLAYEQLLTDYPMWRERLAMVQVCFADQARPAQSKAYAVETRGIADRIRKRFGEEACTFLEVGVEIPPLTNPNPNPDPNPNPNPDPNPNPIPNPGGGRDPSLERQR